MSTRAAAGRNVTINGRKVGAALAQVLSFVTTWMCIHALGFDGVVGFFIALGLEFLLLAAKFSFLNGRGEVMGFSAVLIDTVLNAGGMYPYIANIDRTPAWAMFTQALQLEGTARPLAVLIFSLAFGFLLSAIPTWLWRER